jgi:hypothetical protein
MSLIDEIQFLVLNNKDLPLHFEKGTKTATDFLHRLQGLFSYMMGGFDKDFQSAGNDAIQRMIEEVSPHIAKRVDDVGPKIIELIGTTKDRWDLENTEKLYFCVLQFVEERLEKKIVSDPIPDPQKGSINELLLILKHTGIYAQIIERTKSNVKTAEFIAKISGHEPGAIRRMLAGIHDTKGNKHSPYSTKAIGEAVNFLDSLGIHDPELDRINAERAKRP